MDLHHLPHHHLHLRRTNSFLWIYTAMDKNLEILVDAKYGEFIRSIASFLSMESYISDSRNLSLLINCVIFVDSVRTLIFVILSQFHLLCVFLRIFSAVTKLVVKLIWITLNNHLFESFE